MLPAAIPLIASVASAAWPEINKLMLAGKYRKDSAAYEKKYPRPKYEIPQALKDYLSQAKFRAGAVGLPGQGQAEARMGRQMASSARAMQESGQSSSSIIAGLAGLNQQGLEQQANLAALGAQQQDRRMTDLYGAQTAMASEQKAQFMYDKDEPYRNAMDLASRLMKSADEGKQIGIEGISGILQSSILGGMSAGLFEGKDKPSVNIEDYAKKMTPYMAPERSAEDDLADLAAYGQGNGLVANNPDNRLPYAGPDYADKFRTYFDESGSPYMDNIGFELPNQMTNGFNSGFYGIPIDDQTSDYYDLGGGFNQFFNNIFRRRGSERARTYTR